jgi:hypothetical protein
MLVCYSALQPRLQERHHVIRVRVAPEHRLREDEVAVDVNVEDAVRARYHLDRCDGRFQLLENPRRQTDGVRPRASGHAILDANQRRTSHGNESIAITPIDSTA